MFDGKEIKKPFDVQHKNSQGVDNLLCSIVVHHYLFILPIFIYRITAVEQENNVEIIQDSPQSGYLVDLWQDSTIQTLTCLCFLQKVVKISLKCVCVTCSSVVIGSCSNSLCHCDDYRFVARMRYA